MYPRTNYEMTQDDLDKILAACKPTPVMMIGSFTGSTPQENANRAWAELGSRMGFDAMTVEPREGMGNRFFTAIPNETEFQKSQREAYEKEEARQREIAVLRVQIEQKQARLEEIISK